MHAIRFESPIRQQPWIDLAARGLRSSVNLEGLQWGLEGVYRGSAGGLERLCLRLLLPVGSDPDESDKMSPPVSRGGLKGV
eukprot:4498931-Pyramimonas_sp.AAC.1